MKYLEGKQISHGRLRTEDVMVTVDRDQQIQIKLHNFATQASVAVDLRNFGLRKQK